MRKDHSRHDSVSLVNCDPSLTRHIHPFLKRMDAIEFPRTADSGRQNSHGGCFLYRGTASLLFQRDVHLIPLIKKSYSTLSIIGLIAGTQSS